MDWWSLGVMAAGKFREPAKRGQGFCLHPIPALAHRALPLAMPVIRACKAHLMQLLCRVVTTPSAIFHRSSSCAFLTGSVGVGIATADHARAAPIVSTTICGTLPTKGNVFITMEVDKQKDARAQAIYAAEILAKVRGVQGGALQEKLRNLQSAAGLAQPHPPPRTPCNGKRLVCQTDRPLV